MDDVTAAHVQKAAEVVKGAANVDVGHVHMPVFMRFERLDEAGSFEAFLGIPFLKQSRLRKNTPGAGGTDGDNVLIQHHEGQSPVSFEWIFQSGLDDGIPLPGFEPEITRDRSVMFVCFTVALDPCVKFTLGNRQPEDEALKRDFRFTAPQPGVINHGITSVMGNQAAR